MATEISVSEEISADQKYILYRRRWFMLFIFAFYAMTNSFQWIQYSIIKNIVMKYYDVSGMTLDWTSIIYMVTFVPLIFPASDFLDKKGLRWAIVLGSFVTAAGACIKIASVRPDLFWVTLVGQGIASGGQVFMLSTPPSFAAAWFGRKEVSTACSIGVFGNLLGIALGFLIPPMIVHNHDNIDDIGNELSIMFYATASISTAPFILALIFLQARPPTPPSPQQAMQKENASKNEIGFWSLVKRLFINKGYIMMVIGYTINQGIYNIFSTYLNQLILMYFEDSEEFAGRLGLIFVISGMLAGIVFGIILDRTHRFKEVTEIVYLLSLGGMLIFTFTLPIKSELVVYFTVIIFGSFIGGYIPIAYDFVAELTYPDPEGMVAGIFTVPAQLGSSLFTIAYDPMLTSWGEIWANVSLCVLLLFGTVLHFVVRPELRRQAVVANTIHNDTAVRN